jgi:hypothetical protein
MGRYDEECCSRKKIKKRKKTQKKNIKKNSKTKKNWNSTQNLCVKTYLNPVQSTDNLAPLEQRRHLWRVDIHGIV